METWLRKLEVILAPLDAFSRIRARQFAAAAARFDATGSRDVAEFVAFMERHVVREPESAAVIRVMTIHKAKGLGFDIVIAPDLQGERINQRRSGLAVQKARDRSVEWVLELPPKLVCAADEVLSQHVVAAEAEACYEALSLLYVAFTRAKRAMYAIIEPVGESKSRNYPRLLTDTLGENAAPVRIGALTVPCLWASGEGSWHAALTPPALVLASRPEPARAALDENAVARAVRRAVLRPSSETSGRLPAAHVFALERRQGAEFGAEVHALLAEIEWGGAPAAPALESRWRARGVRDEAIAEALACWRAPGLAEVWRAPEPGRELWRERAFEIVLDAAWITGVFDRVVIVRDAAGRAIRATVFDFKTDAVLDAAQQAAAVRRHSEQLNLYRRVAAVLIGLPVAQVAAELVFTRVCARVPLEATPSLVQGTFSF